MLDYCLFSGFIRYFRFRRSSSDLANARPPSPREKVCCARQQIDIFQFDCRSTEPGSAPRSESKMAIIPQFLGPKAVVIPVQSVTHCQRRLAVKFLFIDHLQIFYHGAYKYARTGTAELICRACKLFYGAYASLTLTTPIHSMTASPIMTSPTLSRVMMPERGFLTEST